MNDHDAEKVTYLSAKRTTPPPSAEPVPTGRSLVRAVIKSYRKFATTMMIAAALICLVRYLTDAAIAPIIAWCGYILLTAAIIAAYIADEVRYL